MTLAFDRAACLDRISSENSNINAVLNIYKPQQGHENAILNGMTVGVKSNIAVRSQVWHAGIKAYETQIASKDAVVIRRLREAGADILCNLNMEEGALGAQTDNPWFGKTYNPIKAGYTPGGSSGGSAAAVAAGFVKAALGTDTMGSVRIPSAYCGLWGFKPSHSESMLDGVMPLSTTMDTVGIHASDLDTLVQLTEIICDQKFENGKAGDIFVLEWTDQVVCEPIVDQAFKRFVEQVSLTKTTDIAPYEYGRSRRAGLLICEIEGYAIHEHHMQMEPNGFSDPFKSLLNWGQKQTQEKKDAAYAHVDALRNADFPDFILMPTTPQTAFKFGDPIPANQADFAAFANLADRPAIQFPIGTDDSGLPIGAQLVGPRGREADLVATVQQLIS